MKEVTYEDWQKNPIPRMMYVWDDNEKMREKRKVLHITGEKVSFPVIAITNEKNWVEYRHCAEIAGYTRRMTNKELSWWLTEKPHREFKDDGWIFSRHYYIEENQFQEVKDDIFIREDGGEWREPLVEVEE